MIVREQDVGRLHVAVHDAAGVRGVERVGHLAGNAQRVGERQRSLALEPLLQRIARDERHDEERQLAPHARVEQRQDVRMMNAGDEPDLGQKPLGGEGQCRPQHLQGDRAIVLAIVGQVDHGGGAMADLSLDLVPLGRGAWDARLGHWHGSVGDHAGGVRRTNEMGDQTPILSPAGRRRNGASASESSFLAPTAFA